MSEDRGENREKSENRKWTPNKIRHVRSKKSFDQKKMEKKIIQTVIAVRKTVTALPDAGTAR